MAVEAAPLPNIQNSYRILENIPKILKKSVKLFSGAALRGGEEEDVFGPSDVCAQVKPSKVEKIVNIKFF